MSNVKRYFIPLLAFFMGLVGNVSNLLQMMTLEGGWWWLFGLLVVAIGYKVAEYVWDGWQLWRASRSQLGEMRELLLNAGRDKVIRECALIRRIRQQGQSTHIRAVLSTDLVVIDVSGLALRGNDELKGTKWTLFSQNGGGQVQGEVVDCNGKQAHVRLLQPSSVVPRVGDLATPLAPGQATEAECLAAMGLCLIG